MILHNSTILKYGSAGMARIGWHGLGWLAWPRLAGMAQIDWPKIRHPETGKLGDATSSDFCQVRRLAKKGAESAHLILTLQNAF